MRYHSKTAVLKTLAAFFSFIDSMPPIYSFPLKNNDFSVSKGNILDDTEEIPSQWFLPQNLKFLELLNILGFLDSFPLVPTYMSR